MFEHRQNQFFVVKVDTKQKRLRIFDLHFN